MNTFINEPIITLGSPYGIGYEIFLRSLKQNVLGADFPVCIGSLNVMRFFEKLLNIDVDYQVIELDNIGQVDKQSGKEFLLLDVDRVIDTQFSGDFTLMTLEDITPEYDGVCAYYSIFNAAKLVKKGIFKSVVTLPVSKKNINIYDSAFTGHTEFFQKFWEDDEVFMTFISDALNILLLTTHIPLNEVCGSLDAMVIKKGLKNAFNLYKRLGLKKDICFLGVNPHAGENGLLGNEEEWIKKIIDDFNERNQAGIIGPVPADTAFTPYNRERFDFYIAVYHDQALIPFKIFSFEDGVNLSWGMKYIRTSVDHGTAVNLIGKKTASIDSFVNAYKLAVKLS